MAFADPNATAPLSSSVLYQNAAHDVTLLDIPTSIAAAQARSDMLLSTLPLQTPIQAKDSIRPRCTPTEIDKPQEPFHAVQHKEYKALIERALAELRTNVSGSWCKPRQLISQQPLRGNEHIMDTGEPEKELESRLREWALSKESKGDNAAFDLHKMMATLGATSEYSATAANAVSQQWVMSYRAAPESTTGVQVAEPASQEKLTEPWRPTFHNPETHSLELTIAKKFTDPGQLEQPYRFTIPPRSTFFLGDSAHSDAFRTNFRELTDEYNLPRHFDLVLLDPPWPNRSAKRKGTYEQVGGMPYLKRMLLRLDIDTYLERNALVAVWVTNKDSLREHVLAAGGLFETWNVGLIEEWVWIKTTTKGEPMFDIDDVMRKPYEVLLLGRAAPNSWTIMNHAQSVRRRVIAAVPDVHSRKPCLKKQLEPYMPDAKDYSALEVFSRHLVSGWTSWGNEVLKFNWERYWTARQSSDGSPETSSTI